MNMDYIIKNLYNSSIKEGNDFYQNLFLNTDINGVTDPYWKEALKMFSELSIENKNTLFKIIEQVQVDTVSNVLGILDGVVTLGDQNIDINMTIEGSNEKINGDLQELFLGYDEEVR
ncbi:transposase [Bacillus sp. AFS001701]|nr:transposase [Bacillus sp. AFS001701]